MRGMLNIFFKQTLILTMRDNQRGKAIESFFPKILYIERENMKYEIK